MTKIKQYNLKPWVNIVLFNLFVLALLGLFLRTLQLFSVGKLNFQYFLHAHSHFAFAGWGFMALAIAIYYAFISDKIAYAKRYKPIFILGLIMAYGMLFSFPFKGYALVSISFSTLFIIVSYWFGWRILKDLKAERKKTKEHKILVSTLFLRAAIFFLIISTVGVLAMGPIMAKVGTGSALYYNSIYFYLHFQYNGWFIFGILALFFKWLEENNIPYNLKAGKLFFNLMLLSAVLTYLLSILWTKPNNIVYFIAGLGAALQLLSILPLWQSIRKNKNLLLSKLLPISKMLGTGLVIIFLIKIFLQFFSVFPLVVKWTVVFRSFVLAYLHLVLLGFFTFFLLLWFIQKGLILINSWTKLGLICFISGFIITELLLFTEGTLMIFGNHILWFYRLMFYSTTLLPIGTGMLFYGNVFAKMSRRTVEN